jgi:hypothetical protein
LLSEAKRYFQSVRIAAKMADVTVAEQSRRDLGTNLGILGETNQRNTGKPGLEA